MILRSLCENTMSTTVKWPDHFISFHQKISNNSNEVNHKLMLFHGKFEIYDDRKFLIYSVKMSSHSVNDLRRFFEDINSNFNRKSGKTEIFIL